MRRQAKYVSLLFTILILTALVPGYQAQSASGRARTSYDSPARSLLQNSQSSNHSKAPETAFPEDDETYVPGQLLVQFAPDTSEEEKAAIHERLGAEVIGEIPELRIQILQGPEEATAMVFAYQAEPSVDFAEPNYWARIAGWPDGPVVSDSALTTADEGIARTPNDPLYSDMWNLPKIQAPAGWDVTVGDSSVTIAVVDTGVHFGHPDLQGKLVDGYDFVNNDSDPSDDQGHGTHVAGTAAAATDNGIGIAGVAWNPKVMPIKSLSAQGRGAHSWIANGIMWAANHGANVINLSIGGPYTSATMEEAVNYAWNRGIVIVAAAGNGGSSNPTYPAAYANTIGVAATTESDQRAGFSNYGDFISIAAPGVGIWSTTRDGDYQAWSGTSMATPHVSGLAALLKSIHPDWSNRQIRETIQNTAVDLGTPGWDPIFGWGLLNVSAALRSAPPEPTDTPTPTPTATPLPPTPPPDDLEQELINLINAERAVLALSQLERDERLMEAARRHSRDLANTLKCRHIGSDDSDPFERISDAGYPLGSASEVIACGYQTPSDTLRVWEDSPPHWAILTNTNMVHIGCGVASAFDNALYWTCNLARPAGDTPSPTFTPTPTGTRVPTDTPTPITPTNTPTPITPTNTPTPTNTRTPSPTPTAPVDPETVYITPEAPKVGWVVSNEEENYFGDDDVYTGIHGGEVYIGGFQFDLSRIPDDAKFNWGRLTLTGQTRDFVGDGGSWYVSLLAPDIDDGWANHGYLPIRDAREEHLLLPILGNRDLQRDRQNIFNFQDPVLRALEQRRLLTGKASFRVEGPVTGANNLFSWDSGFGEGSLGKPPLLTINYTPGELEITPTVPPTASPTPTPRPGETPDISTIELTPPAGSVGWVASHEPNVNSFNDDDVYAGMHNANLYMGGIQFDLAPLPANAEVTEAELLLTGQTRQYLGSGGTWQVEMLDSTIDAGWPAHGYTDVFNATPIGTLEDLDDGDFVLTPNQLDVGRVNRLRLTDSLRTELAFRRQSTGFVSFRAVGPQSGESNVFSWDTGYGRDSQFESPILRITYQEAGSPAPTPTHTPASTSTPTATPPANEGDVGALIDAINQARATRTASPLTVNDRLTQAATVHSIDLATNDMWSHRGSDGSTPQERMRRYGYPLAEGEEALAAGSTDTGEILAAWLSNDKHVNMLMDSDYVHIGAGHAYDADSTYGDYWTVLVARPTSDDDSPPGESTVDITPRASAVGWVVGDDPTGNRFGDDDMYSGFYGGLVYIAAVQFQLSAIPSDAQITGATLKLTGQSDEYLGETGTWTVHLLESSIDLDWSDRGFNDISNAGSLGVVGTSMSHSDLDINQVNALTFSEALLDHLADRVRGTGFVSLRINGPTSGGNNVFSWDSGFAAGLNKPPTLTVRFTTP